MLLGRKAKAPNYGKTKTTAATASDEASADTKTARATEPADRNTILKSTPAAGDGKFTAATTATVTADRSTTTPSAPTPAVFYPTLHPATGSWTASHRTAATDHAAAATTSAPTV